MVCNSDVGHILGRGVVLDGFVLSSLVQEEEYTYIIEFVILPHKL